MATMQRPTEICRPQTTDAAKSIASRRPGINSQRPVEQKSADEGGQWDRRPPTIDVPALSTGKGGGAHRPISDAFKVNPVTGTLSLGFPIRTSEARSGFGPRLQLQYDSGDGNGPFGLGWELGGVGRVTRKTSKAIPKYDESDTFNLSGFDDLVPCMLKDGESLDQYARGGYTVKRYRPRVESRPTRIELWMPTNAAHDMHWRVIAPDNTVTIYGNSDESRIFELTSDGKKRILTWLACYTYDSFGNAIQISYKAEDRAGLASEIWEGSRSRLSANSCNRYLKSIKYGNRQPHRDLSTWEFKPLEDERWMFEVVLDYGEHDPDHPQPIGSKDWPKRSDSFSTCRGGFEVRTHRLCHRVLMFNHIQEEGRLMFLTSFTYQTSPTATLLDSMAFGTYSKGQIVSLPPYVFEYQKSPRFDSVVLEQADTSGIETLSEERVKWLDLDGDGSTGLLQEHRDAAWTYHRNESALYSSNPKPRFGPNQWLSSQPSLKNEDLHYFEDLDGNGELDFVYKDSQLGIFGFAERRARSWADFRPFPTNTTTLSALDKQVRRIDLTGNGLADILRISEETNEILWQECLGKEGFKPVKRVERQCGGPIINLSSPVIQTHLADMSGDGLVDIVHISPGRVSYWPNLGYGRFGDEVIMGNPPQLSESGEFNPSRLRLADLDGSGTTDLIYLSETGGVQVFYNSTGNYWTDGQINRRFPSIDKLSAVFALDLLGQGSACLCWTGPSNTEASRSSLSYLNFSGGQKPHLLRAFSNGLGCTASFSYRPSTSFYLEDEKNGHIWPTKLPFPVHCIRNTISVDLVSQVSLKSTYAYHDGFFDSNEREFRGFAMVETWDSEDLSGSAANRFLRPTTHSKLWFYTGACNETTDTTIAYQSHPPVLASSTMPPRYNSPEERREAFRALKGLPLRKEVCNINELAETPAPVVVIENRHQVKLLQRRGTQQFSVFTVIPKETLSTYYEQQTGEPRQQHEITLDVNEFGDVTKSTMIAYGLSKSQLGNARERETQESTLMTYVERDFTNPIIDERDSFRGSLLAKERVYQIRGIRTQELFDPDKLKLNDFSFFRSAKDVSVEDSQSSGTLTQKICIGERRLYYRSSDLTSRLPLKKLETFSLIDQEYDLGMTEETLAVVYGNITDATGADSKHWLAEGGWVQLSDAKGWWRPSPRYRFSKNGENELNIARASFYTPIVTIDPFENASYIQMDDYHLFPIRITDAVGDFTLATYDYIHLQPKLTTDANGNRTEVSIDSFGRVVSTARMGKIEENVGDSLEAFEPDISEEQLATFIEQPTVAKAMELLRKSGRRKIFDYGRWYRTSKTALPLPNWEAEIVRTSHYGDQTNHSQLTISVNYLDGSGESLQTVLLSAIDSKGTPTEWLYSGWEIYDSKGNPVRKFRPSLAKTHSFIPYCNVSSPSKTLLYDPQDRVVGTLNENRTWNKTRITPWMTISFDEGNTVLYSDPSEDEDIGIFVRSLERSTYFPSWADSYQNTSRGGKWELDAVKKSTVFHNKPTTMHLDPLGRPFLTTFDDGAGERTVRYEFDVMGNCCASFDTFVRLVDQSTFDLLGHPLRLSNLDSGDRWIIYDCNGQSLVTWNSRGICTKREFDQLRRERKVWMRTAESHFLERETCYGDANELGASNNLRGRPAFTRDQSGVHTNVCFDFKGNCLQRREQLTVDYKRDIDWQTAVPLKPDEQTYHVYDALDREVQSTDILGNVSRWEYNLIGQLYACFWRQSGSETEKTLISSTTYSPEGQPTQIEHGNQTVTNISYDEETGNMLRKRTNKPSAKVKPILEDVTYTYDCQNRVTHIEDNAHDVVYFRNVGVSASRDFTYDVRGRLTSAEGREEIDFMVGGGSTILPYEQSGPKWKRTAAGSEQQLCRYIEKYSYDSEGNLKTIQHQPSSGISGWTRNYFYDGEDDGKIPKNNRLIRTEINKSTCYYEYKGPAGLTGCMTSIPGYSKVSWDNNDKMRSSSTQKTNEQDPETIWYVYDSSGRRTRKITEKFTSGEARIVKEVAYIGDMEIYRTYDGDGITIKEMKQIAEVRYGKRKIALVESDSLSKGNYLLRYQIGDHLEVDEQGDLVSYEEYTPYGTTTFMACGKSVKAPSKFRYNSYERDAETGMYLCGSRYYLPWLGRWLSPDPMGTVDGHNLYCYVSNDPVNFIDPAGTMMRRNFGISSNTTTTTTDQQPLILRLRAPAPTNQQQPLILRLRGTAPPDQQQPLILRLRGAAPPDQQQPLILRLRDPMNQPINQLNRQFQSQSQNPQGSQGFSMFNNTQSSATFSTFGQNNTLFGSTVPDQPMQNLQFGMNIAPVHNNANPNALNGGQGLAAQNQGRRLNLGAALPGNDLIDLFPNSPEGGTNPLRYINAFARRDQERADEVARWDAEPRNEGQDMSWEMEEEELTSEQAREEARANFDPEYYDYENDPLGIQDMIEEEDPGTAWSSTLRYM